MLTRPVGLTNPSNLILAVGDVTFQLFTAADSAFIGRTVLPNLTLTGGYQTHSSVGEFEANNVRACEAPSAADLAEPVVVDDAEQLCQRHRHAAAHLRLCVRLCARALS